MLNRQLKKMCEVQARRANGEKGFTLIELLVVIIIIGILASIAIPIFMNQQKTARDAATVSDTKNVATTIQTLMVKYPDADTFFIADNRVGSGGPQPNDPALNVTDGEAVVYVGDDLTVNLQGEEVSMSKNTSMLVKPGATAGSFIIEAWNDNGKSYSGEGRAAGVPGKVLVYDSAAGGIR